MGSIPRDELVAAIRDTNRDRLHRTEAQLRVMTLLEREAAAEGLLNMIGRPPLSDSVALEGYRTLLQELAFDIYDLTDDPDQTLVSAPAPTLVDIFTRARVL